MTLIIVDSDTFSRCLERTHYTSKRPTIGRRSETHVYQRNGAEVAQVTYTLRRGKRVPDSGQYLLESSAVVPYNPWFDWNGENERNAHDAILGWVRSFDGKRAFGCNAGLRQGSWLGTRWDEHVKIVVGLDLTDYDPKTAQSKPLVFAQGATWEEVAKALVESGKMPPKVAP